VQDKSVVNEVTSEMDQEPISTRNASVCPYKEVWTRDGSKLVAKVTFLCFYVFLMKRVGNDAKSHSQAATLTLLHVWWPIFRNETPFTPFAFYLLCRTERHVDQPSLIRFFWNVSSLKQQVLKHLVIVRSFIS